MIENHEKKFLQIYENFADSVFRHCYFRISDREKAKDLTQETFKRIWIHMMNGKEITHSRGFVFRIANNLIVDLYRKKKDDSLDELQKNGFDPANNDHESILNMATGREMLELLDILGPDQRDAIVMRYIDDLMPKEIAQITGVSENVISVRIHRGLKTIREKIQNDQQ